ncbi:MAG TPA: nitroreductase family protein [Spirochaetota bacterium]|nr:nitroreductase family protein [Spirochaetota bacterium]
MNLQTLIVRNRSYRRFSRREPVSAETLRGLVDMAGKSASAQNLQPLAYLLVHTPEGTEKVFPHLKWAGYLKDWDGPGPEEQPPAYIIVLHDTTVRTAEHLLWCDLGLACQNILLGAVEQGLGGCLIGSANRTALRGALSIDTRYEPLLVIALGKPAEEAVLEETGEGGDIRYYRDSSGVHHVPKRKLRDIIIGEI